VAVAATGTGVPERSRARIELPSNTTRTPSNVPAFAAAIPSSPLRVASSSRFTVRTTPSRFSPSGPPACCRKSPVIVSSNDESSSLGASLRSR
jgi:hypothetical protein